MKNISIILMMLFLYHVTNAQNRITGRVLESGEKPLTGATVFIPDLSKGTVTDEGGNFELLNLPDGKIRIQFSFIGYSHHIETVDLANGDIKINMVLQKMPVETEEIVVSGIYNSTQHENAVKIDMLKISPQNLKSTPNFAEALTEIPGVDMISKGNGVSKPVIRGLSMNDILILNNGVRFENYQYSSHHPLGIDEFGIQNIEVIKGPASLLYGSDAIGGVINFIKERPAPVGNVMGDYNLQLNSNTQGITNNLGIKAASKKVFGGIRAGQKSNADFLQGGGAFIPNSRFNEVSVKTNFGFTDKIGTFRLYYDYNNQKLGLVEDEAVEMIEERGRKNEIWYQDFSTHLLSSRNKLYLGRFKLDINSAYQTTELKHFEDADQLEIQMKLATLTYEAKLYLPSKEEIEYILGFQGFNQENKNLNDREVILLPDATTNNYSAFGLVQLNMFKKLKFQTGVRYDYKTIDTKAVEISSDNEVYRSPLSKTYGSFSGSLGGVYTFSESLFLRTNIASAYRTPNLAELTSDGQHELRYEVGDNNLVPENSYEADISLHLHRDNITFDVAGFYNRLNNYIFIAPTGEDTNDGIGIYKYNQADATLVGGEAGIHFHPVKYNWLHLQSSFSSVTGKQKDGDYLPFIPAQKLQIEVRIEKEMFLFLNNTYISLNSSHAFNQYNPAPDESSTDGYNLIDLSVGGSLKVNNQFIALKLSVTNIFDTKYIDHLSTLKEVGMYNPGRNISLSLKVPFGGFN